MHFTSKPYLDYGEIRRMLRGFKSKATPASFINTKFTNLSTSFAGAVDFSVNNADPASGMHFLRKLQVKANGLELVEETGRLKLYNFQKAVKLDLKGGFGETMVAFNTTPVPGRGLPVQGLDVPAYARDDAQIPYGFEVMAGGQPGNRQVLVRLALAAITYPGFHLVGQQFQQVMQIFATSPEVLGTPTPPPPTPAGT
jgi:hypothetical protein